MAPRLLCVAPIPTSVAQRAAFEFEAHLSQQRQLTTEETLECLRSRPEFEAVLTSSRVRFDAGVINVLPTSIKVLATCSVGTDHIDLIAAQARGLVVTNTPDVLTHATADLTFMLLLCASRRAREYQQMIDRGWRQSLGLADMLGTEVSGSTLGIVGMGRIGQAVAQRARGFGMNVLYHSRSRLQAELELGATYYETLHDMLPHCQFLSLHASGGSSNGSLINAETLHLLPSGAVLVNTARGQLIDEDALIDALKSGHQAAAGMDVFRSEPDYDLRLKELPNVFLTPHMGSATVQTRDAMGMRCLDNIASVLGGQHPQDQVH